MSEVYEIDIEKLLSDPKEKTIWDRPVPIVKHKGIYHCYISSTIEEPYNYDELCFLLDTATSMDSFHIHLNTGGGYSDSAFKIISSINTTEAFVRCIITGTVASAGTIIALSCDELYAAPYSHFMIHNYSSGAQGKGHELMDFISFNDKTMKKTFTSIYEGFLTPKEIESVLNGKDMWMDADEVMDRWRNCIEEEANEVMDRWNNCFEGGADE